MAAGPGADGDRAVADWVEITSTLEFVDETPGSRQLLTSFVSDGKATSLTEYYDLLDAGKIRMAGISNANPDQIRLAQEILGGRLVSVQNQFSPAFRSSEPELELCDELEIAFLPWSPLGGISKAAGLGSTFKVFQDVADGRGISPQQVCLAWELAKAPIVIPITHERKTAILRFRRGRTNRVWSSEPAVAITEGLPRRAPTERARWRDQIALAHSPIKSGAAHVGRRGLR